MPRPARWRSSRGSRLAAERPFRGGRRQAGDRFRRVLLPAPFLADSATSSPFSTENVPRPDGRGSCLAGDAHREATSALMVTRGSRMRRRSHSVASTTRFPGYDKRRWCGLLVKFGVPPGLPCEVGHRSCGEIRLIPAAFTSELPRQSAVFARPVASRSSGVFPPAQSAGVIKTSGFRRMTVRVDRG